MRIVGSTMGHDCGSSVPPPGGATVDCTGELPQNAADSSPDVYYLDNAAGPLVLPSQARTSATLDLPPGATVTHARLYWGGRRVGLLADLSVALERVGGGSLTLSADDAWVINAAVNQAYYQSTVDVTSFVGTNGAGQYRVSDMDAIVVPNVLQDITYAAWALVVFFDLATEPFGNRALYDGFDQVESASLDTTLTVTVPESPVHPARLALVVYEGDFDHSGDSLAWNGTLLSNAVNPVDNFFNSSRTELGVATVGSSDVPALSGVPDSMASFDLDIVDVSDHVSPGSSSATLRVGSTSDTLFVGAVVTELQGCSQSSHCSGVNNPACNTDTGDCQPCVVNGDPGLCTTAPEGSVCMSDGMGGAVCGCLDDADCGPLASGRVCDSRESKCVDGCRGPGLGNQCEPGLVCTSMDATIGMCVPCVADEDCTDPSLPHCDTRSGLCGECTENGHCEPSEICDEEMHECVPGAGGGAAAGGNGGSSSGAGAHDAAASEDIGLSGDCACRSAAPRWNATSWLALLAALCLRRHRRRDDDDFRVVTNSNRGLRS